MTAMRLAEHVAGTVDVDTMLENMTPKQFAEWCAKDRVEPIGTDGTNEILSQIAALIARAFGAEDVDQYTFKWWQKRPEDTATHDGLAMALEAFGMRRN